MGVESALVEDGGLETGAVGGSVVGAVDGKVDAGELPGAVQDEEAAGGIADGEMAFVRAGVGGKADLEEVADR